MYPLFPLKCKFHIYNKRNFVLGVVQIILALLILTFPDHVAHGLWVSDDTFSQDVSRAIYCAAMIGTKSVLYTASVIFGYLGFQKIVVSFVEKK